MDRTDLAQKSGAEPVKHTTDCHQSMEKSGHRAGIVRPCSMVMLKRDRIGDFVRPAVELGCAAKLLDQFAEPSMELGNRHRAKRDFSPAPVCCLADHRMIQEIENDLDTCGIWRSAEHTSELQ